MRRVSGIRRYVVVVAVLLLVNWLVASALYGGPERATIAYSPLFLDQVQTGNVAEISSTDTGTIRGPSARRCRSRAPRARSPTSRPRCRRSPTTARCPPTSRKGT